MAPHGRREPNSTAGREVLTRDEVVDGMVTDVVPLVDRWNDGPIDDLRVAVERSADRPPWLTSAALSLVTLRAYPEIELDGVPMPEAGATPEQAQGWPALWFAGRRDIFPDKGDDRRERARKNTARSRAVRKVIDLLDAARVAFLAEQEVEGG